MAFCLSASALCASPSVVVTLSSVGDRIRAQNPDLAAARLRIQEALGRMNQSGRMANPELETGVEVSPASREGMFEIGITQRFPVTARLRLEKEVSLTELKSAEAEVREVERQLVGRAREVVRMLAARQRRELLGEQVAVSKEFADFLSGVAAKGEGSPLDAGQAKLEATSLSLELRQLDAEEAALTGELKPLLGMLPGEGLNVAGNLPGPALPGAAVDPSRRPDFQVARLDALINRHSVAGERYGAQSSGEVDTEVFADPR